MLFPISSVNQTFPSAPVAMKVGNWPIPLGYSSMGPSLGDPPDLVDVLLGEPEVAVRERRDVPGLRVRRRQRVLRDDALRGDLPDLVPDALREPEVAVRAGRDPVRPRCPATRAENSVIVPLGVIRPIVSRSDSVNQRFPSGPGTIVYGRLSACGSGNSVTSVRPGIPAGPTRASERPANTSVETTHDLSTRSPFLVRAESTALRREFLVRGPPRSLPLSDADPRDRHQYDERRSALVPTLRGESGMWSLRSLRTRRGRGVRARRSSPRPVGRAR